MVSSWNVYNVEVENKNGMVIVTCQIHPDNPEKMLLQRIPEGHSQVKALQHAANYVNTTTQARTFTMNEFLTIAASYVYLLNEVSEKIELFAKSINSPMYKI